MLRNGRDIATALAPTACIFSNPLPALLRVVLLLGTHSARSALLLNSHFIDSVRRMESISNMSPMLVPGT